MLDRHLSILGGEPVLFGVDNWGPKELVESQEDVVVFGDIDALMQYIDSGQAERDWHERVALRIRELEELL